VPVSAPKRKTLVFPSVEVERATHVAPKRQPPPLAPAAERIPKARASERPTLKTLPPVAASTAQVIELSASALESLESLQSVPSLEGMDAYETPEAPAAVEVPESPVERELPQAPPIPESRPQAIRDLSGPRRSIAWRGRAGRVAEAVTTVPRNVFRGLKARGALGLGALGVVAVAAGAWGGGGGLTALVSGVSEGLQAPARPRHEAASEHTPLVLRALLPDPVTPAGRCATSGASRVLATRAHLGPGLDVNVVDGGFGVAFASTADEVLGMRLDGTPLRVADRVRVRPGVSVAHVSVDSGHREDDALDVRVDGDDARTIVPEGDAPAFRMVVVGGWIQAVMAGKGRALWPVPGGGGGKGERTGSGTGTNAGAIASVGVGAGAGAGAGAGLNAKASAKANVKAKADAISAVMERADAKAKAGAVIKGGATRTSDGFVRLGATPPRFFAPAPPAELRAAPRDDGGAVIALRQPSALWLGLVDAHLAADGPLVSLSRPGSAIGMPAVAATAGGGAVTWAERPAGDREWVVMVGSFGGGEAPDAPRFRPIGVGMSPSIAILPGGDFLVAYAVGAAGSHRVLVLRLGRDLEPRGEPVVVSPDEVNAGQPAAAVGADGRGLVAFFGAERGRPSSVIATPLSCNPLL